ncbi:HdeD family acid-resistance protein [Blastopirellula retiformator]|uniref:Acid-resistance membrane protein n=1 Tax=Blastopirellula retiformator TaxID=2527970 RepID=A0A5C5VKP7_9BACT|nr:HdeD family acid-resistance protein [Blastopirellula retiformator]TWT38573.1 acid-resistance membrane protein [Blastopirellula retiformator]
MSEVPNLPPEIRHELHELRKEWWWFLLLGVGLIVLGLFALGASFITSLAVVVFFGLLLVVGGAVQIASAFWAGRWSGMLLSMLLGIFYVVTGMLMIDAPIEAMQAIVLLIAAFLIVGGLFRIVAALSVRFPAWGWQLLSGAVSVILGLMINKGWPDNSVFIIGLFLGIELIFSGWYWVMLSIGVRSLPESYDG